MAKWTEERLGKLVVERILIGQVEMGAIDPVGKTDGELFKEFAKVLLEISSQSPSFAAVIDHSGALLSKARSSLKAGNLEIAALFYATWVEHWANYHIKCLAERRGDLSDRQITEILRQVQLRGKLTWLMVLLGGRGLPSRHLTAIDQVVEFRNGFVHYKHAAHDVDAPDGQKQKTKEILNTFENTVRYIQGLDRVVLTKGLLRKIKAFANGPVAAADGAEDVAKN